MKILIFLYIFTYFLCMLFTLIVYHCLTDGVKQIWAFDKVYVSRKLFIVDKHCITLVLFWHPELPSKMLSTWQREVIGTSITKCVVCLQSVKC